jgi:hypothetical protein
MKRYKVELNDDYQLMSFRPVDDTGKAITNWSTQLCVADEADAAVSKLEAENARLRQLFERIHNELSQGNNCSMLNIATATREAFAPPQGMEQKP